MPCTSSQRMTFYPSLFQLDVQVFSLPMYQIPMCLSIAAENVYNAQAIHVK